MGPPPSDPNGEELERRIEAILGRVVDAYARGERVDEAAILDAHPDLRDELVPRLALVRLLHGLAAGADDGSPLRGAEIEPGRTVGCYRIDRKLGTGGMGTVYGAEDVRTGEDVAVKVVHPQLTQDPTMVARFQREVAIGTRLRHPGIVATLDAGQATAAQGSLHYLVMERVEGQTLRAMLAESGPQPEALVREIAQQLAGALSAIHREGLVHRDLKPENVMVTDVGPVRIMDLGMARLVDAVITLTTAGQFTGSLLYAAPEQLNGGSVSAATDLYALGLVLFEMVTGEPPHSLAEIAAVLHDGRPPARPRARARGADLTPFFDEVIHTLLAPEPAERFASAEDLRRVLEAGDASAWWRGQVTGDGAAARAVPTVPVDRGPPLRGRDTAMRRLRACWGRALRGEGGAVVLEGATRMGKTRLAAELLEEASGALRRYVGFDAGGGAAALADGVATLGKRTPALWVLDDLELAGRDAVAAACYLARAAAGSRALVILTWAARPTDLPTLEALPGAERVHLPRLRPEAMRTMLRDAFAPEVATSPFDDDLLAKAAGVPGVLLALLRGLEQDGALGWSKTERRYTVRVGDVRIRLPADLERWAVDSLSRLRDDERALLQRAAAHGHVFDAFRLAEDLGRPPIPVLRTLAEIERRTGIVRNVGRQHHFEHPILRDVLYGEIPRPRPGPRGAS